MKLVWYYLSCAKPKQFVAGIIVQGVSVLDAVQNASAINQAPPMGTEVLGFVLPLNQLPAEKYRDRLLRREEIEEFWPGSLSLSEAKAVGKYDLDATVAQGHMLCPACVAGLCKVH